MLVTRLCHCFLPWSRPTRKMSVGQRSIAILHTLSKIATITSALSLLLLPLGMWPIKSCDYPTLIPQADIRTLRGFFLVAYAFHKFNGYLLYGRVGTKNGALATRNRTWTAPCKSYPHHLPLFHETRKLFRHPSRHCLPHHNILHPRPRPLQLRIERLHHLKSQRTVRATPPASSGPNAQCRHDYPHALRPLRSNADPALNGAILLLRPGIQEYPIIPAHGPPFETDPVRLPCIRSCVLHAASADCSRARRTHSEGRRGRQSA